MRSASGNSCHFNHPFGGGRHATTPTATNQKKNIVPPPVAAVQPCRPERPGGVGLVCLALLSRKRDVLQRLTAPEKRIHTPSTHTHMLR